MLMTSKMVALTFLDGQHNNLQALGLPRILGRAGLSLHLGSQLA